MSGGAGIEMNDATPTNSLFDPEALPPTETKLAVQREGGRPEHTFASQSMGSEPGAEAEVQAV